jgi:crotonobetainyl-CoA:carnitine CoA-transferase CaiB-like acyl-CoA transferase
MSGDSSVKILEGVKVIELAQFVFVPVTGALLADWGADVIKVEHPVTGDGFRGLVSQGIHQIAADGLNHSVELANRGKRSIGLDVKTAKGRALLLELVATADVFSTNLLAGSLARLELGVEDLRAVNPGLIYARGHGQGVRGPDAGKTAYDASAFWARGGLGATLTPPEMHHPIAQRGAFGDRSAAVHLAFGIAAALFHRERTGEGSVVDVSLLATAMWTLSSDVLSALQGNYDAAPMAGQDPRQSGNPLVNSYETRDGRFIHLVLLQADRDWPELANALDRPELASDPRFADMDVRAAHKGELVDILEVVFRQRALREWEAAFADARFPWAPFHSVSEVLEDPQVAANGYVGDVEVEGGEPFRLPTGAVQFDERPPTLRRGPEHGQHTEEVLLELGLDWDEIIALKDARVVN